MQWKDFFKHHDGFIKVEKHADTGNKTTIISMEDLYKAFENRIVENLLVDVPNATHFGKLKKSI